MYKKMRIVIKSLLASSYACCLQNLDTPQNSRAMMKDQSQLLFFKVEDKSKRFYNLFISK